MKLPILMRVGEVAAVLRLHKGTIKRYCYKGILRFTRINERGDMRIHKDSVEEVLKKVYKNL